MNDKFFARMQEARIEECQQFCGNPGEMTRKGNPQLIGQRANSSLAGAIYLSDPRARPKGIINVGDERAKVTESRSLMGVWPPRRRAERRGRTAGRAAQAKLSK
jgi:hypothetical protein